MKANEKSQFFYRTEELMEMNQRAKLQYVDKTKSEGYTPDFHGEVKPFADQVKRLADDWQIEAKKWLQAEQPKYLYEQQIDDTHENLLITSVTAFQPDMKKKRFMETIQSIDYVLGSIKKALSE